MFATQRALGQLGAWLPTELLEQLIVVLARDASSGGFSVEKLSVLGELKELKGMAGSVFKSTPGSLR